MFLHRLNYRLARDFNGFNANHFLDDLDKVSRNGIIYTDNVDTKVKFLNTTTVEVFSFRKPLMRSRFTRKLSPWLTNTIKQIMKLLDEALKRYSINNRIETWNYYKSLRNFTNLAIKEGEKTYFQHCVRCGESDALWKTLNLGVYNKSQLEIPSHLLDPDDVNNYLFGVCRNRPMHDSSFELFYNNN